MAIFLGALFVATSLIASTFSAVLETRAAGNRRVPLWSGRRGYERPRASLLLLLAAVLFLGIGATFLLTAWGPVVILLSSLVFLPPVIVIAVHNRSLPNAS